MIPLFHERMINGLALNISHPFRRPGFHFFQCISTARPTSLSAVLAESCIAFWSNRSYWRCLSDEFSGAARDNPNQNGWCLCFRSSMDCVTDSPPDCSCCERERVAPARPNSKATSVQHDNDFRLRMVTWIFGCPDRAGLREAPKLLLAQPLLRSRQIMTL